MLDILKVLKGYQGKRLHKIDLGQKISKDGENVKKIVNQANKGIE